MGLPSRCHSGRCAAVLLMLLTLRLASGQDLLDALTRRPGARVLRTESADNSSQNALLLPLQGRTGFVRRRSLLRAAVMPVDGAVREVGYFYVTLGLGTPSKDYQLIIDTGSTITYVPCSDCRHCGGSHKHPPFDPAKSSTSTMLGCNTPKCNCGTPNCQCFQSKCFYSRTYAERSSSEGFMLEDVMRFLDVEGSVASDSIAPEVRVVFGCEYTETGEIYRQVADGILGMGNNDNALQSQLVQRNVIADTFSLCFGYPHGGTMLLGDVSLTRASEMVWTPLKPGWQAHYYTITVQQLLVGGVAVASEPREYAQGYGSVLDSGTTFTYFPTRAFNSFAALICKAAQDKGLQTRPGADPQYNDICWKGAPHDITDLDSVFPRVELVMAGMTAGTDSVLVLKPLQYLFVLGTGSYCLGVFDNGNAGTLLGGITVRNVLVQYDRRTNKAGFLPLDSCSDVSSLITPPPVQSFRHHHSLPPSAAATVKALYPSPPSPSRHVTPHPPKPPAEEQPEEEAAVPVNGSNATEDSHAAADTSSTPRSSSHGSPAPAASTGQALPPPLPHPPQASAVTSPPAASSPPASTKSSPPSNVSPHQQATHTAQPPSPAPTASQRQVSNSPPPGNRTTPGSAPPPQPAEVKPLAGVFVVERTPSPTWSLTTPLLIAMLLGTLLGAAWVYRGHLEAAVSNLARARDAQDAQELMSLSGLQSQLQFEPDIDLPTQSGAAKA
ncbi:hypothetical protein QJQ45_024661 [Haematococcus lacustris]|nr:hypothetical protein QJQ45_024661 [Haematococcus lacustris]